MSFRAKRQALPLCLAFFILVQLAVIWTLVHSNGWRIAKDMATRNSQQQLEVSTAPISQTCPTCPACPTLALSDEVKVPVVSSPAPRPHFFMVITVFTYNRLDGLKTLLSSLVQSNYLGRSDITLRVFLDFPKKGFDDPKWDATRRYLDTFMWPHGPLHVHRRLANAGLKKTIMESWYPSSGEEVAAFFEDDIEVSLAWFVWVDRAMRQYFVAPVDAKLLGLSLFRPIRDELSGRDVKEPTSDGAPFVLQQPCSWGAVYFPAPWKAFRNWYDAHSKVSPQLTDPADGSIRPSSNTWDSGSSWKKYLIKLMYEEGWYMVYPNFPDRMVLATNHLLPGVHPTPPKKLFELPLLPAENSMSAAQRRSFELLPPVRSMKAYNVMYSDVGGLQNLHGYTDARQSA